MYVPRSSISLAYARARPRTHAHTPTASHTLSVSDLHRHDRPPPCHIYPQQCGGEEQLLLVSNKRATSEWEEAKHSLILPLWRGNPQPSLPCRTLVSLQMKWTNAKSMFLVLLLTIFIPPLIVSWQIESVLMAITVTTAAIKVLPSSLNGPWVFVHAHASQETHLNKNNRGWCCYCANLFIFHLFCINAAGFSQTISSCAVIMEKEMKSRSYLWT